MGLRSPAIVVESMPVPRISTLLAMFKVPESTVKVPEPKVIVSRSLSALAANSASRREIPSPPSSLIKLVTELVSPLTTSAVTVTVIDCRCDSQLFRIFAILDSSVSIFPTENSSRQSALSDSCPVRLSLAPTSAFVALAMAATSC